MLPKVNRLPAAQIRPVLRTGKKRSSDKLQIIYRLTGQPVSRFAFVVSTRIDKRAVARNRIKRLLRESVRHLLPQINTGFDVIILVKAPYPKVTQREMEDSLRQILILAQLIQHA